MLNFRCTAAAIAGVLTLVYSHSASAENFAACAKDAVAAGNGAKYRDIGPVTTKDGTKGYAGINKDIFVSVFKNKDGSYSILASGTEQHSLTAWTDLDSDLSVLKNFPEDAQTPESTARNKAFKAFYKM